MVPDDPRFRPHGYVEDHAVIRRIGERDLSLGNVHAADPDCHDRSFDFVLSATSDSQPHPHLHELAVVYLAAAGDGTPRQ